MIGVVSLTVPGRRLGLMPAFFDPQVCSPPNISELAVPIEKSWTCPRRGRPWVLEHFWSVDGDRLLGPSWILEEATAGAA
jgi:hypothetical protein